jgi:hypothetical protein
MNKHANQSQLPPIVRPSVPEIGQDFVRFFGAYAAIGGMLALLIRLNS